MRAIHSICQQHMCADIVIYLGSCAKFLCIWSYSGGFYPEFSQTFIDVRIDTDENLAGRVEMNNPVNAPIHSDGAGPPIGALMRCGRVVGLCSPVPLSTFRYISPLILRGGFTG